MKWPKNWTEDQIEEADKLSDIICNTCSGSGEGYLSEYGCVRCKGRGTFYPSDAIIRIVNDEEV